MDILLVTSYNVPCGIAQYAEYLKPELDKEKDFSVDVAELPIELYRTRGRLTKKRIKAIFKNIVNSCSTYDIVILQLEYGLYGLNDSEIHTRLRSIIKASKKIIITHHTILKPADRVRFTSLLLKPLALLKYIFKKDSLYVKVNKLFRRYKSKIRHLVHTKKAKFLFELQGIDNIYVKSYPLAFLNKEIRLESQNNIDLDKKWLSKRVNLNENNENIFIGGFGFISPYKGYETLIKAIRYLPENYHLIIAGSLHPASIKNNIINQPYLEDLMKEILGFEKIDRSRLNRGTNKIPINRRIHFLSSLSNMEFLRVMNGVDNVVLPYAEVGQTSSGPASLALELSKKIFCSNTPCFKQLSKFAKGKIRFFEISNYFELAELIQSEHNYDLSKTLDNEYIENYNIEKRVDVYRSLIAN